MATLNIKDFPDDLYEALKRRARSDRRSVAQEVVHLLERAVEPEPASVLELLGLGSERWAGVDAALHVDKERDSWG